MAAVPYMTAPQTYETGLPSTRPVPPIRLLEDRTRGLDLQGLQQAPERPDRPSVPRAPLYLVGPDIDIITADLGRSDRTLARILIERWRSAPGSHDGSIGCLKVAGCREDECLGVQ
jgi:hypothetical protein